MCVTTRRVASPRKPRRLLQTQRAPERPAARRQCVTRDIHARTSPRADRSSSLGHLLDQSTSVTRRPTALSPMSRAGSHTHVRTQVAAASRHVWSPCDANSLHAHRQRHRIMYCPRETRRRISLFLTQSPAEPIHPRVCPRACYVSPISGRPTRGDTYRQGGALDIASLTDRRRWRSLR